MPVRFFITVGTTVDYKLACDLVEGISVQFLLAEQGYNTDKIINTAKEANMIVVIPLKRNPKEQQEYDKDLYKLHHLIENAFLSLKRWRKIAIRVNRGLIEECI